MAWVLSGSGKRGEVQHGILLLQRRHKRRNRCGPDSFVLGSVPAAAAEVPLPRYGRVQRCPVGEQHHRTSPVVVTAHVTIFPLTADAVVCQGTKMH